MKNYNRKKETTYLKHWDVNNLYRWAMPQKLLVNDFKWVEETSQFNDGFIKIYNEDFLKLIFSILKNYITFTMIYLFCMKEWKSRKLKNSQQTYMIKNNI